MKLGVVTEPDKRNKATSKKFDYVVISTNRDIIFFFPIYGQFAAIQKLDSGRMVYKTYIFINSNLYLTEPESRTKKSLAQLLYYCFK